jgi:SNF2 family DNA or RNA helicase
MLHLHGIFNPDTESFYLWAENETLTKRRKSASSVKWHPFSASGEDLRNWIVHHSPHVEARSTQIELYLPSYEKSPQASPELTSSGFLVEADSETVEFRLWQVVALEISLLDLVDLLLNLPAHLVIGRDMQFWRLAVQESLSLLLTGQFIPALEREGFQYHAFWQMLPEDSNRIAVLAEKMPSICRSMTTQAEAAIPAYKLINRFITSLLDKLIRDAAKEDNLHLGHGLGAAWISALTKADNTLKLANAEAQDLYKAWQDWAGKKDIAGNAEFRIAFRLDAPDEEKNKNEWSLSYLLQAIDDPSLIVSARQIWKKDTVSYLEQRFEQAQERFLRGLAFAGKLYEPILKSLRSATPEKVSLKTDEAYQFVQETAPILQASGFRLLLPRWWSDKKAGLSARAKLSGGKQNAKTYLSFDSLVNYDYQLILDGQPISYEEFMQLAELKQGLVRFRGKWVFLDAAQIEAGIRFFEQASGELKLGDALRIGLDSDSLPESVIPIENLQTGAWFKKLIEALQKPEKIEVIAPSEDLEARLRPYQERGLSWLAFLWNYGIGACLADDMGLGKTLQVIAFLLHMRQKVTEMPPVLVVCPSSVVGNWRREIQRFAPNLQILSHQGGERSNNKAAFSKEVKPFDVILTSYPLLARDRELLEGVKWSVVILDEAQNIKNSSTKQAQAARAMQSSYRLAMTGTPVENRLSELWSIFHFLNPHYLGSEKTFRRQFANPIERLNDANAANRLKRLTAPFILRRLKTDPKVISDLPEKLEMKVYTHLTQEQGTLYEAVVQDIMQRIEEADSNEDSMSRRGLVLSLLMQLKQICNHPAQYLKDKSALSGRSGKLNRLTEILEEVYASDDRALIFTQFAEMGELLRTYLRDYFFDEPLWLHGATKIKEREEMIRRFQAERGPRLFILSIKAGGVGLNLTNANHVFHFDRWWNPAVENQATDRAFRIGQKRNVQVHKFICTGTLEERIDEMIEAKKSLADSIVGSDESWLTELDSKSLRDLVKLSEVGD